MHFFLLFCCCCKEESGTLSSPLHLWVETGSLSAILFYLLFFSSTILIFWSELRNNSPGIYLWNDFMDSLRQAKYQDDILSTMREAAPQAFVLSPKSRATDSYTLGLRDPEGIFVSTFVSACTLHGELARPVYSSYNWFQKEYEDMCVTLTSPIMIFFVDNTYIIKNVMERDVQGATVTKHLPEGYSTSPLAPAVQFLRLLPRQNPFL